MLLRAKLKETSSELEHSARKMRIKKCDMAAKLRLSPAQMGRLLAGKSEVLLSVVEELADATGASDVCTMVAFAADYVRSECQRTEEVISVCPDQPREELIKMIDKTMEKDAPLAIQYLALLLAPPFGTPQDRAILTALLADILSFNGDARQALKLYAAALDTYLLPSKIEVDVLNSIAKELVSVGNWRRGLERLDDARAKSTEPHQIAYNDLISADTKIRYLAHQLTKEEIDSLKDELETAETHYDRTKRPAFATASNAAISTLDVFTAMMKGKPSINPSPEALQAFMDLEETAEEAVAHVGDEDDAEAEAWPHIATMILRYRVICFALLYPDRKMVCIHHLDDLEEKTSKWGLNFLFRDAQKLRSYLMRFFYKILPLLILFLLAIAQFVSALPCKGGLG